jgi:hypothetical protein
MLTLSIVVLSTPSIAETTHPHSGAADFQALLIAIPTDAFEGNKAAFAAHFAAGATYTAGDRLETVEELYADARPDPDEHEWVTVSGLKVATYGDTVVATYRAVDHERWPHRSLDTYTAHTDTFVWSGGQWLEAAAHSSITASPPVPIDAATLARYAGTYRSKSGDTFALDVKRGKLFSTETGDRHPYEMDPTTATSFFSPGDPSEYVMVIDAQGVVVGMLQVNRLNPVMYERVEQPAASVAAAPDQAAVMAPIHQYVDGINRNDVDLLAAACASPAAILDDFPPHVWQGPTACADWKRAFDAYDRESAIADAVVTLGTPTHVNVTGDRAYAVIPSTYNYLQSGKPVTEAGSIWTFALTQTAAGWRITAWAWSDH